MKCLVVSSVLVACLLGPTSLGADEASEGGEARFQAEAFYRDLRRLVREQYPEATAHRVGDTIHVEYHTRIFLVHNPLKTGVWQDAVEERGPRTGGIHCDLEFRAGAYGGAACVPQTFDKRYFQVLLRAPYDEALDGHLYTHLKIPAIRRPPEAFLAKLIALIDGFGKYTTRD